MAEMEHHPVGKKAKKFVDRSYDILCALFDQRQVASNSSRYSGASNSAARCDVETPSLDALQISTVYLMVLNILKKTLHLCFVLYYMYSCIFDLNIISNLFHWCALCV